MMLRLVGAAMLVAGCGGFGYTMSASHRREMRMLRALLRGVQEMEWELKYRLTELPGLCRVCGCASGGELRSLFRELADRLESCAVSEISGAMNGLVENRNLPGRVRRNLKYLGQSLGRYGFEGQLEGLQQAQRQIQKDISDLEQGSIERMRSWRTLGLCAGTALAILLL